jgi:hypothetical protein
MKDVKLLYGRSAGRCAFPTCRIDCAIAANELDEAALISKIAHIVAHGDKGPRADATLPPAQRDRYDNLILLCSQHHDVVDAQDCTYDVETLRRWKKDHEAWVNDELRRAMPTITFAQLEVVCSALIAAAALSSNDLTLRSPAEKMKRNQLTAAVEPHLQLGIGKAREVASFVDHVAKLDPGFPGHLRAGFELKYAEFRTAGVQGDDLFQAMYLFASSNSPDLARQAAGLAVLGYLFELCEVFEK